MCPTRTTFGHEKTAPPFPGDAASRFSLALKSDLAFGQLDDQAVQIFGDLDLARQT